MKSVNAIFTTLAVISVMLACSLTTVAFLEQGENYETEITAGWAETPPTIDGEITSGEYSNATVIDMEFYPESENNTNATMYIYFANDNEWLYIAVDIPTDNASNEGDSVYFAFDEDNNDVWEPDMPDFEAWYGIVMQNYSGVLIPEADSLKPSLFMAGYTTTENEEEVDHRVWEIMIPISSFIYGELGTGDTVGVALWGVTEIDTEWDYPINITLEAETDAELWAKLTLADEPTVIVEDETDAGTYGMMMIGIAAIILLILVAFHKETFVKWIGENDYKMVFIFFGLVLLLLFLGIAQWYYNWLSYLGIG